MPPPATAITAYVIFSDDARPWVINDADYLPPSAIVFLRADSRMPLYIGQRHT